MRISTNQLYLDGLSALLLQQERVSKLQMQLADKQRVRTAADDPVAFSQIELMNQRISATETYQNNRQNAENVLSMEELILNDCTSSLQRLRDIQVQSSSSVMSQGDRQALAVEVQAILHQLCDSANSKDINGDYMFSGGKTGTQPFLLSSTGQYVYQGDSTQRFQQITNTLQTAINDPGDGIFMRLPGGNGTFAISQTATPNIGTASLNTGSITDISAYIPDDYTMSFVLNTQGQLVVMVTGLAGGNVIPPSGLPDDAPLYQEGKPLGFNGMEMIISGEPQPGDSFSVVPAQNKSIFASIQSMIANLNKPYISAADKAATVTENNQLLTQIDTAMTSLLNAQSNLGSRLKQLDQINQANTTLIDASTIALKYLQEADPVAVATEFNQELVYLQAAQQSFVRIQGLSVFNFM